MLYLDTSLITAALVRKVSTEQALAWLAEQDAEQFAISAWAITGQLRRLRSRFALDKLIYSTVNQPKRFSIG